MTLPLHAAYKRPRTAKAGRAREPLFSPYGPAQHAGPHGSRQARHGGFSSCRIQALPGGNIQLATAGGETYAGITVEQPFSASGVPFAAGQRFACKVRSRAAAVPCTVAQAGGDFACRSRDASRRLPAICFPSEAARRREARRPAAGVPSFCTRPCAWQTGIPPL